MLNETDTFLQTPPMRAGLTLQHSVFTAMQAGRPWHYPQCTEAVSIITTPIQAELVHLWCGGWGRGKRSGGEERDGAGTPATAS